MLRVLRGFCTQEQAAGARRAFMEMEHGLDGRKLQRHEKKLTEGPAPCFSI